MSYSNQDVSDHGLIDKIYEEFIILYSVLHSSAHALGVYQSRRHYFHIYRKIVGSFAEPIISQIIASAVISSCADLSRNGCITVL
jgi:hypothetical protein